MKISLFVICGLISGGFLGAAVGMAVNAKWSPLTGLLLALLMCIGTVIVIALFFAPSAPMRSEVYGNTIIGKSPLTFDLGPDKYHNANGSERMIMEEDGTVMTLREFDLRYGGKISPSHSHTTPAGRNE